MSWTWVWTSPLLICACSDSGPGAWGAICMGLMKGLRNKECHVKKILELTEHTTIGEIPEEETVDFDVEA